MFNLLPKAKKDIIHREYRVRLSIVGLWLLFVVLVAASLLLFPAFLLSAEKEKTAQERFAALRESVERNSINELDDALSDLAARLSIMKSESPNVHIYEALTLLASIKTDGISLSNISFVRSSEGRRDIAVSGVAASRSGLVSFVQTLERAGIFEKVDAPISNFVKEADINFEIRASASL
ncbi:MAG: hypothetical protein A2W52_01915 [Candidatus Taylorbacteria bacterium RIFCSPHIGHO2_02_49_25]|uniref:Uncharacterized protein n=1 Tax=Candidatus Taylorbacteria bacterium RIFCSPHIGHO2_02_49_25 TaxID=1802305 RepID=A0A1G2MCE2_9BACT|nr:MAG: hypothetical protein A2759_03555 [Candidatus Taylorbacteria bacterium RIFCSPHIGHO2_01_FULL_49_60]OHA21580.1 MAG: hypothetical protein A2W52_01915 [Candidatus Taylorbacteria bacterium RIFCSPHIGHO2_02_49_25]OHA36656.1 MAG: hypothetical protein A3B27_00650 [Candidatus Taylorbacteria bacterium RIFCSPLOWO2_01_FULL_50_130]OHA42237.1 MAG: hypothetical protein A3H73_02460 [Candidatus Taylorbacteria bacterium RIFCSPLOWO2_02_FULL_50_120]OHA46935.1 MAG: hypothetical protein A3G61_04575 [Candidatus